MTMRWEDERYVRIYTRDSVDWLSLSFDAQALFLLLLRKVDRAGLLRLGRYGARGVAISIGHASEWPRLEKALEELVEDGCVTIEEDVLMVPNFIEAQEARTTDKQRQREARARARDKIGIPDTDESHDVTPQPEPSHAVTPQPVESHAVTPSLAVLSCTDPPSSPPSEARLSLEAALQALDASSSGAYVYSAPDKGQAVTLQRYVTKTQSLDAWNALGAYLREVRGDRGGEPLGTPLLAHKIGDLFAKCKRWLKDGKPQVWRSRDGQPRHYSPPKAPPPPPPPPPISLTPEQEEEVRQYRLHLNEVVGHAPVEVRRYTRDPDEPPDPETVDLAPEDEADLEARRAELLAQAGRQR